MRRLWTDVTAFLVLVASFTLPATVNAAPGAGRLANAKDGAVPGNMARAQALFREGLALWQADLWAGALERFEASIALHPTHAAYVNMSLCLEKLGRNADALAAVEKAIEHANGDEVALARKRSELLRFVGRLTIRGGAPGTAVLVDGKEQGRLPLAAPLLLDAGVHLIRVAEFSRRIEVRVDEPANVDVPVSVEPAVPAPAAAPATDTARLVTSGSLVAVGIGSFVAAGLFAGASNRSLARARTDADACGRCAEAAYADAGDARTWSRVALVAGAGLTIAGGAAFAWWPRRASVAVSGTGISIGGEF
jgi:tetratricopeptide (TPR) repeat protein